MRQVKDDNFRRLHALALVQKPMAKFGSLNYSQCCLLPSRSVLIWVHSWLIDSRSCKVLVYFQLILFGACIGVLSGMLGIGGGIILVPGLILLFGFTQQEAQGTSLAVLSIPIFAFAA